MRKKTTVARISNSSTANIIDAAASTGSAQAGAERRVTSYDVALLAGVSQSAVSRCFKPGASVSPATHAKVMQAAIALDYIPNAAARSLITRRSNLVAVIISNLANLYYPQILSELSQQIARQGKRLLLFTLEREADIGKALCDVWQYQVDGAIVAAWLSDEQMAEFARRDVPLVLFNRNPRDNAVPAVLCDQAEAARLLVSRLAEAGHRQFAIIDGPGDSAVAQERKSGVLDRLLELRLPAPIVVSGNYNYASGGHGLRKVIDRLGRVPDAVICGNDIMAIGCLDTARHELGIQVPLQMSVAGFDALEASGWLSYDITTLRQPVQKMAIEAVAMLNERMERRGGSAERRRYCSYLVEGSTARLSAEPVYIAQRFGMMAAA
ncbi:MULTISPECIES: LacI family DNA-binding transcriptional regulator [unclassified Janthinobacterium]|uniref:LacI family DNA-binding transcriptional regulator n=1 Tax=unclassified Janthinobacterium TaxID=2610881 RepID=UPI00161364EC|nr:MULTISPECIES: LacI family DNA-binding transcriptional regulator [unclassified Janthinobacterium]MBB5369922.1 DNA-binding LacI/PurR family transcriptional regulator [Janthinobacterium sp. K2C7]MBB5382728.1 DNA-binding LacI/PurR family transcriptional regulator [Janthinobacterium sp. K2Li3]MBB5384713.1 DNA-binding LacI/PurR family transcriptional regulator [Janthinobacterium sp. K2E3]